MSQVVATVLLLAAVGICSTLASSFYDFSAKSIDTGVDVSFSKYKGAVSLVVNVASQCGFTDGHYKAMKRIQDILGGSKKFNVLAFPSNDFDQEPWENDEIKEYVRGHFKADFPVFQRDHVKGENAPEHYKWLAEKSGKWPTWNFHKYLISEDGTKVLHVWDSNTSVESVFEQIQAAVDGTPVKKRSSSSSTESGGQTSRGDTHLSDDERDEL